MNLLATGHMLADVVAIMGKFFLTHTIFSFSCPVFFSGQSRLPLVGNLSFARPISSSEISSMERFVCGPYSHKMSPSSEL